MATKETLNKPVRPKLVEGQSPQKQGLRQVQPERKGIDQCLPKALQTYSLAITAFETTRARRSLLMPRREA